MKAQKILSDFLPPHEIIHSESESIELPDLSATVGGIAISFDKDDVIFGSALAYDDRALEFAAYECLERFVISRSKSQGLEQSSFRASISNGVALHHSLDEAKLAARLELLERSEILRSWYENSPVERINLPFEKGLTGLKENYDIIVYEFSNIIGYSVLGIFAFPKKQGKVFLAGFGAGLSVETAYAKALKEFLARYHFLKETEPPSEINFSATADYHQDYYLFGKNYMFIQDWLLKVESQRTRRRRGAQPVFEYQDITPSFWAKKLYVVRAMSPQTIPLFFGKFPTTSFNFKYRCDIPHPIF